jgi:alcohol dehydrogenase
MENSVFITGVGSGLGKALAEKFVSLNFNVYALSRNLPSSLKNKINFIECDLQALETVYTSTEKLLKNVKSLKYVILNAGILGDIKEIHKKYG